MRFKKFFKKIKLYIKGKSLVFLILCSFAFLSIGFAASEAIMFDIRGIASANDLHAVYITSVNVREGSFVYNDMTVPYTYMANPSETSIIYSNNYLSHEFDLGNDINSSITYQVNVLNNSSNAVRFSGVVYEVLEDLGINTNPYIDYTVFGDTDSVILDIGESKVINIRFKYKSGININDVDDTHLKFSISINNTKLARVSYVNFLGYEGLPKYGSVGETLTYTFNGDVPNMIVIQNNVTLQLGTDYFINDHTFSLPITNYGNISITRVTDYPDLYTFDLSRVKYKDKFYLKDGFEFSGDEHTLYWEVDMNSHEPGISLGNVISIGTYIKEWGSGDGGYNFHMYYPENGKIVFSPLSSVTGNKNLQFYYPVDFSRTTIGKFALNSNGLFYNGELILSGIKLSTNASVKQNQTGISNPMDAVANFFNQLKVNRDDIQIGSVQGSNRSTFTYNSIREIDQKLNITQMIDITSVGEHTDIRSNIPYINVPISNFSSNNIFSLGFYDIFLHCETLVMEFDPSTMTNSGFENIISLGKEIDKLVPVSEGNANFHFFFNKDTRQLKITPTFYGADAISLIKTISSNHDVIKIAIGRNGLYVNGELICSMEGLGDGVLPDRVVTPTELLTYLSTFLYGTLENVYSIEIGSKVGDVRSTCKINNIKIYASKFNQPELLFYTAPIATVELRDNISYSTLLRVNTSDGINENLSSNRFIFGNLNGFSEKLDSKTVFADIDLSSINSTTSDENTLSIGTKIQTWDPKENGHVNIHFYYVKNNNRITVDCIYDNTQKIKLYYYLQGNSKRIKLAFNTNGLYINGERIFDSSGISVNSSLVSNQSSSTNPAVYFPTFFNRFATTNNNYKIGSIEGNPSTVTYNGVRIYNELMTAEELVYYTSPDRLNTVSPGSFVQYVGNNGCVGTTCNGINTNANGNNGYCVAKYTYYNSSGWRVAYINDGSVYLVSAGAPECLGVNNDGDIVIDGGNRVLSKTHINIFMNNLSNRALGYCNVAYSAGGVCNNTNTWFFDAEDYRLTMLAFDSSSNATVSSCQGALTPECGQGNPIIDTTGYYRINTVSDNDIKTYYYHGSIGAYKQEGPDGFRPVIKLDKDVYIVSGSGTASDPYVIGK